ncbi:MAG: V-type ATP synthase subunit A, partial [Spirochaetaceae bacterium]|nr:V-type ATP synthase subunit A [Spirochaetaceae bacterium]
MSTGSVTRVAGPIVHARGLSGAALYDVVRVGELGIVGEIVKLDGERAVIQVYEDNTMMRVGEPVVCEHHPLSVMLGPGLIGSIYDGIQRPLPQLKAASGAFLLQGVAGEPLDRTRTWHFVPAIKEGETLSGGQVFGSVQETSAIRHLLMAPPGMPAERVAHVAAEGDYRIDDICVQTEGGRALSMVSMWPVRQPRPVASRQTATRPLSTGLRVIDMLFPVAKGGAAAIPGGFGTGKTMTQHAIAKWCDADLILYIGCGERGNEMTEVLQEFPQLVDPRTGRSLMERTILVANTSNMPVAAREVSIYTGITIAEYYRDMGLHVALMADSTSRWAEALRELSGRLEEMPAEEGFPAYLPSRLAEFYERAGSVHTLGGAEGSITIIGAVSPPGGDFSEPVTQHTKRFIRAFWALDRELANARHYPAISWNDSYSEYAETLAPHFSSVDPDWVTLRRKAMDILKRERKLSEIVRLIGPDALPEEQRLVLVTAEHIKNGFLQQSSFDPLDAYCTSQKQLLILRCIMKFHEEAERAIGAGIPLLRIVNRTLRERIMRLKSVIPNDRLDEGQRLLVDIEGFFASLTAPGASGAGDSRD